MVNIQKGTSFAMEQRKVNDEVWLPAVMEGQGQARALLVLQLQWERFGRSSRTIASSKRHRRYCRE